MTGVLVTSRVLTRPDFERIVASAANEHVENAIVATPEELTEVIARHPTCDVVLADMLPSSVAADSAVRWIQTTSAGVDHLRTNPLWERRSVAITMASGLSAVTMAQYALAYVLRFAHSLVSYEVVGREPEWKSRSDVRRPMALFGRTLGIVGYGGVGQRVAHVARAFGLRVIAVRHGTGSAATARYQLPFVAELDRTDPAEVWSRARLPELLRDADFLVVAASLTSETEGLIGAKELALMKPTSYIVNVARGKLIDESALANALNEGRIAGAALDVFSTEPPDPRNPVLSAKNAIITPHVSGAYDRVGEFTATLFISNLARYRAGQALLNVVDRDRGY